MPLREDLLPLFDLEGQLAAQFDLRAYALSIRAQTRTAAYNVAGVVSNVDTPLSPQPIVKRLNPLDASFYGSGLIDSVSGRLRLEVFRADPVTRAYGQLVSALVHTGTGAGTAAPSTAITQLLLQQTTAFVLQVLVGGAPGVATFQYSLDGGSTFTPVPGTPSSITVPAIGLSIALAGIFVASDTYAWSWLSGGYELAHLLAVSTTDAARPLVLLTGGQYGATGIECEVVDGSDADAFTLWIVIRRAASLS